MEHLQGTPDEPMSAELRISIAQQLGDKLDAWVAQDSQRKIFAYTIRNNLLIAEVDEDTDDTRDAYNAAAQAMIDAKIIEKVDLKKMIEESRPLYP